MKKNTKIVLGIIGIISFILCTVIFFSYNPIIAYDTGHYLWLTDMLKVKGAFSNWDIARGIGFPLIIFITNMIFGESYISLLITMYIFYIVMCIVAFLIYREFINTDEKLKLWEKILIIGGFLVLVAFNPIIFGFYHALLTEFPTMTMAILICYMSWKWIYVKFNDNKKKYISYSIIFAVLSAYMYQLKQPYVGAIVFPIIVAMIISIIKDNKLKNIIARVTTVATCFLAIIISIVAWKGILLWNNVNMNYERSSSGFLSLQMVDSISKYRTAKNVSLERIKNDEKICEKDKEELEKIINGTNEKYKGFILLEEKNYSDEVDSVNIIYTKETTLSVGEATGFIVKTLFTHPTIILKSYYRNFLVTCDIYQYSFETDLITKSGKIDWLYTLELEPIPYRIFHRDQSSILPGIEYYEQYIAKYRVDEARQIPGVNAYMKFMTNVSSIIYKIQCLFLPILTIISVIRYLKYRKKYDEHQLKCVEMICILYGFSLVHMTVHILLRATIDRYMAPAILTSMIAIILDLYIVIYGVKNKERRPVRKS